MENIFDTHSHYTDSAFDEDRDAVLQSIHNNGVKYIMLVASSVRNSVQNDVISRKYDFIYASAGVHPEDIDNISSDYLEKIEKIIISNDKMKAVGEIGLDYHYENYNREKQIKIFREQIELALKLDIPVIVHNRDATEDTLNILREYQPKGVVHCFSGSAETAKEIIRLGMYIGFTGVITFKNARKALEALAAVPLDRLVLETDCPYMAPVPFRGKRCDSSMIPYMAEKAAEIKGSSAQEILDITCRNGLKLFEIEK